jgi:hypothetical protein
VATTPRINNLVWCQTNSCNCKTRWWECNCSSNNNKPTPLNQQSSISKTLKRWLMVLSSRWTTPWVSIPWSRLWRQASKSMRCAVSLTTETMTQPSWSSKNWKNKARSNSKSTRTRCRTKWRMPSSKSLKPNEHGDFWYEWWNNRNQTPTEYELFHRL